MFCLHDGEPLTAEMAAWAMEKDADGFMHGQPYSCHRCGRPYAVGTHDDGRIRVTELPPYKEREPWPPQGSFAEMEERAKQNTRTAKP